MSSQRPRELETIDDFRQSAGESAPARDTKGVATLIPSEQLAILVRFAVSADSTLHLAGISPGFDAKSACSVAVDEVAAAAISRTGECSLDRCQASMVSGNGRSDRATGESRTMTCRPQSPDGPQGDAVAMVYILVQLPESQSFSSPSSERNDTNPCWLKIDESRRAVWVEGRQIDLSRKEYDAIWFFSGRRGTLCTKEELVESVWPDALCGRGVSDAAIDQLIHRLRRKIEPDPEKPTRLVSRKGFGYMLV
jgi:hypothetical protein